MMREWKKIDVHRMDKFYMLTRDFFGTCLVSLDTKYMIESFLSFFVTKVFNGAIDQGIEFKLHLIDILLDELVKAQTSAKLTTGILLSCIRSILFVSRKHVYVTRMKKRVIDRIFALYTEAKLQIDMNVIGDAISEIIKHEKLFKKTQNWMIHLSRMFLTCKKIESDVEMMETSDTNTTTPSEEVNATFDIIEEDKEMVPEPEAIKIDSDTEEVDRAADDTESYDESTSEEEPEKKVPQSPLLRRVSMPAKIPTKVTKKIAADAGKRSLQPPKKNSENDDAVATDRKVTFGKKYTKKFKKGEVYVKTSQGTVTNTQMKSILKKN